MAKAENFFLETRGGALVLQQMAKEVVISAAERIRSAAVTMSGSSTGHKANLKIVETIEGIGGNTEAKRFTATIVAEDLETEAQMRRGNYIAKAVSAGKVS